MNTKQWMFAIVETVIWYAFIYYFLYSLQNDVTLWLSALILLGLAYLGTVTCPLVHESKAWKRMWNNKK